MPIAGVLNGGTDASEDRRRSWRTAQIDRRRVFAGSGSCAAPVAKIDPVLRPLVQVAGALGLRSVISGAPVELDYRKAQRLNPNFSFFVCRYRNRRCP